MPRSAAARHLDSRFEFLTLRRQLGQRAQRLPEARHRDDLQLAGVIIAYAQRRDAPDWVHSHYRFQIRTFWIAVLSPLA